MTDQPNTQTKAIVVSNYDKIKILSRNKQVLESFTALMGNRAEAQAYISSALLAVATNRDLMECQPASIMSCALRAAALRLSCDPSLGQAYLVPYNDRQKGKVATVQLGYKGIEQMALRTNKYRFINTGALYRGQVLEQNQLTGAVSLHGNRESDEVIGYFNYFELFSGYSHCLFMTVGEIRAHAERYSQNYRNQNSKWHTEFDKMAKKTVLRLHLLRDGILSTQDKALLEGMKVEGEVLEGEVIDTTFEDVPINPEDAQPVHSGKSEEQLKQELGFDADEKKADPAPAEPKPETPAAPAPQPAGNGKPAPAERTAEFIKAEIARNAEHPIRVTPQQLGLVVPVINRCFPEDQADGRRKAINLYLTGHASYADMPDNVKAAMFMWLKPYKAEDGQWHAGLDGEMEIKKILAEIDKANGSQEPLPFD